MKPWNQRLIEIRNLFNPAFCGVVLFRAFSGFEEEDPRGMPFSLALLILPLCLHKQSRGILQRGSRSYFLKAVSSHPELLVNFGPRANALLPFTFEALGFLMQFGAFSVDDSGRLKSVPGIVRKSLTGTDESMACQRIARFLGKEFARAGDRSTIYTTLGVRP
jgi:hypothetical protein